MTYRSSTKKFWANYIENKTENNSFKDNEEFQEALKSFELAYYKSMKKSPEANKVITSYKQNQYSTAVDHMTQLGKMNERLAEELHTREEADRLRQEALVLEETIRISTEAFERDREKFKESVEIKMSELLKNIEQQKNLNEEMKQRFIEERDSIVREFDLTCDEIRKDIKISRDEKNHKCIIKLNFVILKSKCIITYLATDNVSLHLSQLQYIHFVCEELTKIYNCFNKYLVINHVNYNVRLNFIAENIIQSRTILLFWQFTCKVSWIR
ncbi:hypothetical protein RhiirA4_501365 [Rhizophagus irregularis]|uniref:Uncharacterized protein n=1 Tax=Rhizophagus irregularis TaxID=588596 RepID=A0A2I1FUF0_9GLOM|nr:hypothetical protein RhiirA4_501365 [Rhizophagus irregularis]